MTALPRETKPFGFGSQTVGSQLIMVAQEGGKQISVLLGRWEMLVAYFKHGLEIPLCLDSDNVELRDQHRVILTGALSMGEMLVTKTKSLNKDELKSLGYSRKFLESNLRYLRDTYEQWYIDRDQAAIDADYKTICDALSSAH